MARNIESTFPEEWKERNDQIESENKERQQKVIEQVQERINNGKSFVVVVGRDYGCLDSLRDATDARIVTSRTGHDVLDTKERDFFTGRIGPTEVENPVVILDLSVLWNSEKGITIDRQERSIIESFLKFKSMGHLSAPNSVWGIYINDPSFEGFKVGGAELLSGKENPENELISPLMRE